MMVMSILFILNIAFGGTALLELLRIRDLRQEIADFKKAQAIRFREVMEEAWGDESEGGHWMEEWCADCEKMWGLVEESEACVACCCAKAKGKTPPGFIRREVCFDKIREVQDN